MFGIKELLIVLVVVILLFGTKKLRSLGSDLGSSVKGFKKAMEDENSDEKVKQGSSLEEGEEPLVEKNESEQQK